MQSFRRYVACCPKKNPALNDGKTTNADHAGRLQAAYGKVTVSFLDELIELGDIIDTFNIYHRA